MKLASGGTELMVSNLYKYLPESSLDGINLIVNSTNLDLLVEDKINVLWNHHNIDQDAIKNINLEFGDKIDAIIYVSHWQYNEYLHNLNFCHKNSYILKNAIDFFEPSVKSQKIRIVYTSTPWRGLDMLLDSFEMLHTDDVELHVFSSTLIYGEKFHNENDHLYQELYRKANTIKGVTYHGYQPNEIIRQFLTTCHIFAYPSIWKETSCIAAIEAAMSGLSVVTTNLGALPETLSEYARFVPYSENKDLLTYRYSNALKNAIDDFKSTNMHAKLNHQVDHFKKMWSWDSRIKEWIEVLESIKSPYIGYVKKDPSNAS